ncbi:ABC transporter ATP-binding protein [Streptomyces sp. NPDC058239]|uniref:ABC transporter ATP-binding protein n=1 Tax=Streptomyces sp. NPDC058239 TaxID=3346395 RepID=UPI0036EFBB3E
MSNTAPAPRSTPATDTPVAGATGLEIRIPGGPVLLHPASLTVRPGQITALTGPSGSGKTTLLRAFIGRFPDGAAITSGTLDVLGHRPDGLAHRDLRNLRRHRIAYVGQDPGSALNPRMKIRSIVAETATDPSDEAVLGLLRECRLPVDDGLPDRRPTAVSGGQQRRVALARALARTPEILLLDEPTAGLDSALRDEIAELLRDLATSRGLAIVMACHDPELVKACADHVVHLTAPQPAHVPPQRTAGSSARPMATTKGGEGLVTKGVSVAFTHHTGHHQALDTVDFGAAPGSATGIVGPSGSGKTTLLRVLAGLQPANSGELALDGNPLAFTARKRPRRHHRCIQLVPQNPLGALNPSRTIGATLARPLRLHTGLPRPGIAAKVADLLHQVELPADFTDRYPGELSGGQRQRVSIARALATDPDYLLCDEITSALDPETAVTVMDLLARLRADRGLTIVIVSHELHLITAYTDTVYLLDTGKITASGPTAKVMPSA